MSSIGRAIRSAISSLKELVTSKELAGSDSFGNKYYRWTETVRGNKIERRQIQVGKGDMNYDPKDIPSEWRMWLYKTRQDPPTTEELERSAAKAAVLRQRVAELHRQEQAQAFRAQAGAQPAQPSAAGDGIMQQIASKMGTADTGPAAANSAKPTPSSPSQNFSPDSWMPPKPPSK